jgi:hypothetical protein
MPRSPQPRSQAPSRRTPLVIVIAGVALVAGVYVLDRTRAEHREPPATAARQVSPDGAVPVPAPSPGVEPARGASGPPWIGAEPAP